MLLGRVCPEGWPQPRAAGGQHGGPRSALVDDETARGQARGGQYGLHVDDGQARKIGRDDGDPAMIAHPCPAFAVLDCRVESRRRRDRRNVVGLPRFAAPPQQPDQVGARLPDNHCAIDARAPRQGAENIQRKRASELRAQFRLVRQLSSQSRLRVGESPHRQDDAPRFGDGALPSGFGPVLVLHPGESCTAFGTGRTRGGGAAMMARSRGEGGWR